ncbi:MAG TPA: hypothetical protein VIY73_00475 [Polyangiaceae bacterium]
MPTGEKTNRFNMLFAPDERRLLDSLAKSERMNASDWIRRQVAGVAAARFGENRIVEVDGVLFEGRDAKGPDEGVARRVATASPLFGVPVREPSMA